MRIAEICQSSFKDFDVDRFAKQGRLYLKFIKEFSPFMDIPYITALTHEFALDIKTAKEDDRSLNDFSGQDFEKRMNQKSRTEQNASNHQENDGLSVCRLRLEHHFLLSGTVGTRTRFHSFFYGFDLLNRTGLELDFKFIKRMTEKLSSETKKRKRQQIQRKIDRKTEKSRRIRNIFDPNLCHICNSATFCGPTCESEETELVWDAVTEKEAFDKLKAIRLKVNPFLKGVVNLSVFSCRQDAKIVEKEQNSVPKPKPTKKRKPTQSQDASLKKSKRKPPKRRKKTQKRKKIAITVDSDGDYEMD